MRAKQLAKAGLRGETATWEWDLGGAMRWSESLHRMLALQNEGPSFEGFLNRVHPADRAWVKLHIEDALSRAGVYDFKHRIVMPDGAVRTLRSSGFVERDRRGAPARLLGMAHDITDREQAKYAQQQTTLILSDIHQITSSNELDTHGKIRALLQKGCERFGLPIGIVSRVAGEQYEVLQVVAPPNTIQPGAVFPVAQTFCEETCRREGPLHFADVTSSVLRGHPAYERFDLMAYIGIPIFVEGQLFGTLNFSGPNPRPERFTETDDEVIKLMAQWVGAELWRENARQALQRSELVLHEARRVEALGRLASALAHDFNNLLMVVQSAATLAQTRVEEGSDAFVQLGHILRAVQDGTAFTRDLRYLGQGNSEGPPIKIDPDQVIGEMQPLLRRLMGPHITVQLELTEPGLVRLPEGQLESLLLGLATNACDAISGEGTVRITTRRESRPNPSPLREPQRLAEPCVVIGVTDTGCGMDEAARRRAFDPFFSTKSARHSRGLGLSVVRDAVCKAGGYVALESTADHGTEVRLCFPVAD